MGKHPKTGATVTGLEATFAIKRSDFGMKTALVNPWFDVDSPADLERLRRQLAADPGSAPVTAEYLRRIFPGP